MNAERLNRIVDAVEDIERNVERLRELRNVSFSAYTSEGNQDLRDVVRKQRFLTANQKSTTSGNAVERKFEKLTEAILDIARGKSSKRRWEKLLRDEN